MFNKAILIGRLTKDPEIRYTTTNQAVCEFNIAVDRPPKQDGKRDADFLNCVVWGKQAENLVKYQKKGSLIAVEGSNRVDQYKNEKGENRYKNYILVSTIQYLSSKKDDTQQTQPLPNNEPPVQYTSGYDLQKEKGIDVNTYFNQNEDVGLNPDDLPF